MKIICMIPARMSSSRVKKKNIRMLGETTNRAYYKFRKKK